VAPEPVANVADALLAVVRARGSADAVAWLERGMPRSAFEASAPAFFAMLAGAGRRFRAAPALTEAERAALVAVGVVEPSAWSLVDLARAALLLRATSLLPDEAHVALATEVFRKGDTGERVSLLRSLALLPRAERFAPIAVDACRSHVLDVLLAVAHHNPLPARHFSEQAFNQLVMKVLFVEQSLGPVVGFRERVGADLVRMARDFEAERRAAGRPVPKDLPLVFLEAPR